MLTALFSGPNNSQYGLADPELLAHETLGPVGSIDLGQKPSKSFTMLLIPVDSMQRKQKDFGLRTEYVHGLDGRKVLPRRVKVEITARPGEARQ